MADKKVMAFGTFDILHPGHLAYLKEAKELGDLLTVIVSRDRNAEKLKSRKPHNNQENRLRKITSLAIVDEAILGSEKDFFKDIRKIKPDFIALGYDQKADWLEDKLKKENLKIEIKRMNPFEEKKYKSSLMRKN